MTEPVAIRPRAEHMSGPVTAERIAALVARQRQNAPNVRATTAKQRIAKLKALRNALLDRREALYAALDEDMGKPPAEVDGTEIMPMLIEFQHTIRHLRKWMKPKRIRTPLSFLGTTARIYHEPKGVAAIIAPWNYPVQLAIGPLISAVAAGNCVVIKPSEVTPHASSFVADLVAAVFDESEVAVIQGDAIVAQALLHQPLDHIFFTGSTPIGKLVMEAAAQNLASVSLELGGKSPAIVDETADVAAAARKLAWGKFTNAGQTCIAPDYLFAHSSIYPELISAMAQETEALYGDSSDLNNVRDYTHIVDDRHFARLKELLDDAIVRGARCVTGGNSDTEDRMFAPTILENVSTDSALMQDEVFGPILSTLPYDNLDDVIEYVNSHEKPLSLYLFTEKKDRIATVMSRTTAGTTLINDTLVHFTHPSMPFGGVNDSGIGKAHGHAGFMAFTNERPTLRQHMKKPLLQKLYPPYTAATRRLTDLFFRYFKL